MKKIILFTAILCFGAISFYAQTLAPGAPGNDAQWSTAGKQGIGTSASLESKIWFTLAQGALTEVYYPDVTVANVHLLQFVVVDPKTKKVETERDDATHQVKSLATGQSKLKKYIPNVSVYKNYYSPVSMAFEQWNTSKSGEWNITKTYLTDPKTNTVLISVNFTSSNPAHELYVYYDPSLANTGMHDTGWTEGRFMYASEKQIFSALTCGRCKMTDTVNGFLGVNDGLTQLRESGKITQPYSRAENGNLVQVAKITPVSVARNKQNIIFALGFGNSVQTAAANAQSSLTKGVETIYREYQEGWLEYLTKVPKVEEKYQAQFNMAAMVLKAYEDKTVRGANVASLTIPWGGGLTANEDVGGGYHLVWSRDLYQVFTAYLALGDTAAAERALDFLFKIQQKPDGSFPQNSWLDGRNGWGGLQMDEVGYPLIMAYQLKRFDKETYEKHVKRAADFIVKNGPVTPQERWEEKGGYSPSTIAAEIAGLVCAAEIAKKNGDTASADLWLKTADDWQANIEKWTATTNGKYGDGNYYVRLTANGKPDAGEKVELNNNAGTFFENEIVDAGFLELVRLGIKSPDDPLIVKSLKVVDDVIRVKTPHGDSFYRYNNDGYGEMDDGRRWNWDGKYTGKGRLWALLSGERGQYELAQHHSYILEINKPRICADGKPCPPAKPSIEYLLKAQSRLASMASFANEGLMIAEQVWDKPETPKNIDRQFVPELKFGEGTGSATPLAWSMAQFIRLAVNLQAGKNLDTPDVVYDRYVLGKKTENSSQKTVEEANLKVEISTNCYSEWSDKNKTKKLQKSPQIVKCKDGSYLPIIVYSGKGKNVEVVGDFTGWKPQNLSLWKFQPYAPIEGENLDFSSYRPLDSIASSARVEYKLIVDGKWINDPLNPNKIDNGVGSENSFFEMPDYKPTEWANAVGQTKYGISIEKINSKIYGEKEIQVYVPEGFENQELPVLYLQDGTDYQKRADSVFIQRNLVKANKIKPFMMVFLDPKDRNKEYWANDDYAKFVATEVVPAIDAKYKTVKTRDGRAIIGASLGGITSIHTALKYPEIFGRIGAQSASFWVDNERVIKELEQLNGKTNFVFYIDDGTLEGVEDSHKAVEILQKKGFAVTYNETEVGHNWTAWRDRLADAFLAIWK
ncbi:MAG TPA: glycoside hydrolase family 15 protein [Pyrinomonadaceae bacterium]|nr:glycoside hydrolase family 15 protein [Pyrinomonadaceae bacterium]